MLTDTGPCHPGSPSSCDSGRHAVQKGTGWRTAHAHESHGTMRLTLQLLLLRLGCLGVDDQYFVNYVALHTLSKPTLIVGDQVGRLLLLPLCADGCSHSTHPHPLHSSTLQYQPRHHGAQTCWCSDCCQTKRRRKRHHQVPARLCGRRCQSRTLRQGEGTGSGHAGDGHCGGHCLAGRRQRTRMHRAQLGPPQVTLMCMVHQQSLLAPSTSAAPTSCSTLTPPKPCWPRAHPLLWVHPLCAPHCPAKSCIGASPCLWTSSPPPTILPEMSSCYGTIRQQWAAILVCAYFR